MGNTINVTEADYERLQKIVIELIMKHNRMISIRGAVTIIINEYEEGKKQEDE